MALFLPQKPAEPVTTQSLPIRDSSLNASKQTITARIINRVQRFFGGTHQTVPPRLVAPVLGTRGEPLRVLAFAGGGLDTVMQLGVTHALLVSKGRAPDIVSGVSAGAINAVALAEILQAGRPDCKRPEGQARSQQTQASPEQQLHSERVAQVSKFREVFESYLNAPGELIASAMPDAYEVNARAPLRPQELPIHDPIERDERGSAVATRFGLVRLLNGLLSIRLPISTLTVLIRRLLEIVRVKEMVPCRSRRCWLVLREYIGIWWLLSTRIFLLSQIVSRVLLGICLGGSYRALSELNRKAARTHGSLTDWEKSRRALLRKCLSVLGFWQASSAKEIISQSKIWRLVLCLIEYAIGLGLAVWLLTFPFFALVQLTHWVRQFVRWWPWVYEYIANHTRAFIWWTVGLSLTASLTWLAQSKGKRWVAWVTETLALKKLGAWLAEWALGMTIVVWLIAILTVSAFITGLLGTSLARLVLNGVPTDKVGSSMQAFLSITHQALDWFHAHFLKVLGEWWGVLILTIVVGITIKWWRHRAVGRLLASFDLESDLLTPFVLKPLFVRLFDRDYYSELNFKKVLNNALTPNQSDSAAAEKSPGKRLSSYVKKKGMPIYVAPAVANLAKSYEDIGQIEVAGLNERVVDALLAACAVTPLFRAQQLSETASKVGNKAGDDSNKDPQFYIDASNVANDPSFVILRQLRRMYSAQLARQEPDAVLDEHVLREDIDLEKDIKGIRIYPVSPFPVSQGRLETDPDPLADETQNSNAAKPNDTYSSLVENALHALQLQRFQDATLERKFIQLYVHALPPNVTFYPYEVRTEKGKSVRRVAAAAEIYPIETDRALNLNIRLLGAKDKQSRRDMVAEAVADGCRAALQVMMAASIQHTAKATPPITTDSIACRRVVLYRVGPKAFLPGSADEVGPGLPEVCQHCCLNRRSKDSLQPQKAQSLKMPTLKESSEVVDWPMWVDEHTKENTPIIPYVEAARSAANTPNEGDDPQNKPSPSLIQVEWPRLRDNNGELANPPTADKERPTVSFLFSGGVFRGVFQVGVVNALNEAGVRPDLLAGASVGTITSAMVGSVFKLRDEQERRAQVAKLAAVFLAIDRLILTDRFADFIRLFTLRAAEARFSLRDADHLFRRYDRADFHQLNEHARSVAAGLERLFHLNPFKLTELTKALRNGDTAQAWKQFSSHVGEFLDRYGVGQEILGAEPLALLIREVVLGDGDSSAPEAAEFDHFLRDGGFHMLATTTNLTRGRLEILSSLPDLEQQRVLLKEGLLASSAFPAVFRPRSSWEVYPQASSADKFVDGGVMDNLPLDAVISFLWRAYKKDLIRLLPTAAPHLLFTASLQVRQRELGGQALRETAGNWNLLRARAQRLSYNQKIDRFAEAQKNFRAIRHARSSNPSFTHLDWKLFDLETVVVKPEWLVGTFAFNPMLGFRRKLQAASIAHGCASTFAELQKYQNEHPVWATNWKLKQPLGFQSRANGHVEDAVYLVPLTRTSGQTKEGVCCFRDSICPFSKACLEMLPAERRPLPETVMEIDQIYRLCGDARTHRPDAAQTL
jgi:predicted acylesterase/phospholipase RssA